MQIFRAVIPPLIHLEGGAVFKILKWLFIIALVLALAGAFWMAFGLWTGIYSLYSYPPSKAHPDGATLLITRDEKEPTFNSPDYNPPARQASSEGGMSFESLPKLKRPIALRTVVKFPYIEWAYKKSLEKPEPEKK
jgi:hypothetical protein